MAELLARYPWEWFVNLTFVDVIHPESALKSFRTWISILNTEIFGRRWRKKKPHGVYWAVAIEYQKRNVLHFHALLAGVKDTRRLTYMDTWAGMGGKNGFSRIYAVESRIAVSRYLTKYVSKDGEIYFSDNLPDMTSGFEAIWHGAGQEAPLSESNTPQS